MHRGEKDKQPMRKHIEDDVAEHNRFLMLRDLLECELGVAGGTGKTVDTPGLV